MPEELQKCLGCRCFKTKDNFSVSRLRKPFKSCDKCREKARKNSKMQKKIKCELCEYEASRGSLNLHIKHVHDKIRDFKCEQCDYECSTNSDLNKHFKAVHDKIKNFKCEQCDYECSSSSHLNRHIEICTGESNLSSGEYACKKYLDKLQIDYVHNTSFELTNEKGNRIQWDFILNIHGKKLFIEYNGSQHYKPTTFGAISQEQAIEKFEIQQLRDRLRQEFCDENEYPLLWIKYTDFKKIDDLILEFVLENSDWDGDRHD